MLTRSVNKVKYIIIKVENRDMLRILVLSYIIIIYNRIVDVFLSKLFRHGELNIINS